MIFWNINNGGNKVELWKYLEMQNPMAELQYLADYSTTPRPLLPLQ
jgi:hypothetical protein